jgi:penicillin-binding protein-related factor A (putative recombinase)
VEHTQLPRQQSFSDVAPGQPRGRESHGNRGKDFERILERTHRRYREQGVADVDYIPNAFVYCSEWEWKRLPRTSTARMGDGRTLKRVQTSSDYRGTLRGLGLAFDAKEFSDDRLSLKKLPRHQVDSLARFARARGIAGFMVWAKRAGTVYWVPAALMSKVYYEAFGKGVKTLNLAWFEEHAVRVAPIPPDDIVDYAAALTPQS